jgi:hypothetical protein
MIDRHALCRTGLAAFAVLVAVLGCRFAHAQTPEEQTGGPRPQELPPTVVTAPRPPEAQPVDAASERKISGERALTRPAGRPGEVLEVAPGLIVTQHSGEGKANQYFLRGFNLDHGTDLALFLDGMPLNMRTHGHGQGYADINFLIPELLRSIVVRKGPYFADEGDFSSAGAIHLEYVDKLDRSLVQVTGGSFGYWRALAMTSFAVGPGTLLAAGEATFYDGPWKVDDNVRKLNAVARYSQGTQDNGFSVMAMAYHNRWTSTDQIPARAVESGLIDRFGTLDPTDGGYASRFSLSGRWSQSDDHGRTRIEAYAIRSTLNLFNDFTYFLDDPVNGDQFRQLDKRTIFGLNASHTFIGKFDGKPTETLIGIQGRYDDIRVALFDTLQRTTLSTVRDDRVKEASIGFYVQNTTRWTDWMRTIVGLRGDYFSATDRSDTPANAGKARDFIASPKGGIVFGPFAGTELFLNAGMGFHSNDVRGVTITVDPVDKVTPQTRVPLLVRSKGAEVGVRMRAIKGLDSSLALFVLMFDSEILFVGDAGTTEPSRPSRRFGAEWTNHYQAAPWLAFDLDLAATHARFTNRDPAGPYIPGAPAVVISAGIDLGEETGWFGGLRFRYFGPRPLVEDNSVRSRATALVNGRIGYAFDNGLRIQLDGFNLLNAKASQIDYFYASRLQGEPAGGVDDRHFHPVEPRAFRLTLAKAL